VPMRTLPVPLCSVLFRQSDSRQSVSQFSDRTLACTVNCRLYTVDSVLWVPLDPPSLPHPGPKPKVPSRSHPLSTSTAILGHCVPCPFPSHSNATCLTNPPVHSNSHHDHHISCSSLRQQIHLLPTTNINTNTNIQTPKKVLDSTL
jgi:hypothetical protein